MNRHSLSIDANESSRMEGLYREYAPAGLRYAMGIVGNQSDAEEIVQDSFLRLIRSEADSAKRARNGDAEFQPVFFTTIRNLSIDLLRRRQRTGRESLAENEPAHHPDLSGGAASISKHVKRVLDQMPSQWSEAIRIRMEQELSYEQIAARMGATKNQVRTWIFRGRSLLRSELSRLDLLN